MPDTRSHRGPHPEDDGLFAEKAWPRLRSAVRDLAWLLEREYSIRSALDLVGNRYQLTARQRLAVERATCSPTTAESRGVRCVPESELPGKVLWLDGYNVLLTIEAALGGGVVLACVDGTFRDMASVHGTYRTVDETQPALRLLGDFFEKVGCASWTWWLDRPVSNSGRLKTLIECVARNHNWAWTVELVMNPDPVLANSDEIVATADSHVLDRAARWFNLVPAVMTSAPLQPRLVDLRSAAR